MSAPHNVRHVGETRQTTLRAGWLTLHLLADEAEQEGRRRARDWTLDPVYVGSYFASARLLRDKASSVTLEP